MSIYFIKTGVLKSLKEMGYKDAQSIVFNDQSVYTESLGRRAGERFILQNSFDEQMYNKSISVDEGLITHVKESWFKNIKIELNKSEIVGKKVEVFGLKGFSASGYCRDVTENYEVILSYCDAPHFDNFFLVKNVRKITILNTDKIIELFERP